MADDDESGTEAVLADAVVRADTEPPESGEGRTPDEWALIVFAPVGSRPNPRAWCHAVAEALHGWSLHAHHEGAPMRLTRAAYEAAVKAATEADEAGKYAPHAAALSPHAPTAKRG